MKLVEVIELAGTGQSEMGPLPLPLDKMIAQLERYGYHFENPHLGNPMDWKNCLQLFGEFEPGRLEQVEQIVKLERWEVRVIHSLRTEFDELDFQLNPLCSTFFAGALYWYQSI